MNKKLYHGTSEIHLQDILENGLRPRGEHDGNWSEAPSRHDRVYLTDTYPLFFADMALVGDERSVVIEIDTDHLEEDNMRPDEDFIVQVLHAQGKLPNDIDIKQAAATFDVDGYAHEWEKSLLHLGNAAYVGTIPVEAITRIAIYKSKGPIIMGGDPCITMTNHRLLAGHSRALIAWLFDGTPPNNEHITEEQILAELEKQPDDTMFKNMLEGVQVRRKWFAEERKKIVEVRNMKAE